MSVVITPSSIIQQAFQDLGVVVVGEAVSSAVQADAFLKYKALLSSTAEEGVMALSILTGTGVTSTGTDTYAMGLTGVGAPITTLLEPVRAISWKAKLSPFETGGRIASIQELRDAIKNSNGTGRTSALPEIVACTTNIPGAPSTILITLWPTPSASNAALTIDYWGVQTVPVNVGDAIAYNDGWEAYLVSNLALALAPQYARVSGITEALAVKARNSKEVIIQKNAAILALPMDKAA